MVHPGHFLPGHSSLRQLWGILDSTEVLGALPVVTVAKLGEVEVGLMLSKVLDGWKGGGGGGGRSGTWAAALCLMTHCRLVIVAMAYAQAFVRSRSQQS